MSNKPKTQCTKNTSIKPNNYIAKLKIYLKNAYYNISKCDYLDVIAVAFLMIVGIGLRIISFGQLPCGLNQDEAFAGYEAYSLANYGIDSSGYHNPCYFVSWGSGMNVLESYLAIPFVKLFGLSVYTIRLPQLICSCISLFVFYLLLKEMFNKKVGIIGLFVLTISPWHIMLSRWGLESNLAPAFLLFGFYFFVKGIKNNKYWMLSALMYGTALYAYSITWVVVPVTIFFMGLYVILSKQKLSIKYVIISAGILFVLALPLILFMLVNNGYIPEITTRFFSVPKLVVMRESDIALKNIISPEIRENFFNLYFGGNDGLIWNTTEKFGLFYKISTPFIILGFVRLAVSAFLQLKQKKLSYSVLILIATIFTFISCLSLTHANVNRINSIHIFTAMLITLGLYTLIEFARNEKTKVKYTAISTFVLIFVILTSSFFSFTDYYFNDYNNEIAYPFNYGIEESISYVNEHNFEKICVEDMYHSQILFYDKTPTPEYLETVEFSNYPSPYLNAKSFTKYYFDFGPGMKINNYDAFIVKKENIEYFKYFSYQIVEFGKYIVAHK